MAYGDILGAGAGLVNHIPPLDMGCRREQDELARVRPEIGADDALRGDSESHTKRLYRDDGNAGIILRKNVMPVWTEAELAKVAPQRRPQSDTRLDPARDSVKWTAVTPNTVFRRARNNWAGEGGPRAQAGGRFFRSSPRRF